MKRTKAVAVLLACSAMSGCGAYRNLPSGGKAPASAFEQMMAWNSAAAQANQGFADNVIGLNAAGMMSTDEARDILVSQGNIAAADKRITEALVAAMACGVQQVGANPTTAQLDSAAAACSQQYSVGISRDISLMLATLSYLTGSGKIGVKDPAKQQALAALLETIRVLVQKMFATLQTQGVVK